MTVCLEVGNVSDIDCSDLKSRNCKKKSGFHCQFIKCHYLKSGNMTHTIFCECFHCYHRHSLLYSDSSSTLVTLTESDVDTEYVMHTKSKWSPFGKVLLSRLTICTFCIMSFCNFVYFPFWFQGVILIVSVPGHCLSFHLSIFIVFF